MTFDAIRSAVETTGLGVVGWFHTSVGDGVPEGLATILLLGPADAAMWRAFRAAPEYSDGQVDPLDRWSRRIVEGIAIRLGGVALFPFGGPPWHPFQRWAARGEGAVVSPVAMQATSARGLWASYRGALAFADRIALPPRSATDPCRDCPAPCLAACPVDAFAGGEYDVPRCVIHVLDAAGTACRSGCLVRASCPAGAAMEMAEGQRAFHMAAFLTAQAQRRLSAGEKSCGQIALEVDESPHPIPESLHADGHSPASREIELGRPSDRRS